MISCDTALARLRAKIVPRPIEWLTVADVPGRVLAEDIVAPSDLPPFANSAMDGFAFSAEHLKLPVGTAIKVVCLHAAGDPLFVLGQWPCQIMTGAIMPIGAVTVVPIEQVRCMGALGTPEGLSLVLDHAPVTHQHIRLAGEDITQGTPVCRAGTLLAAKHVMLFAALGLVRIPVRARIKAAVFYTGDELVSEPMQALASGQIRNSNGPYLLAQLQSLGVDVIRYQHIADNPLAYVQAVRAAEQDGCQFIISTGAVSMGAHDFIPEALNGIGADVLFHKLSLRPAKPVLAAVLPSGLIVFGLPGNPMSCAVGMRLVVTAAIRRAYQQDDEVPIFAVLEHEVQKKAGWQLLHKARLTVSAHGTAQVCLLHGQESFRIQPFIEANVWAVLPETLAYLPAGTVIACWSISGQAFDC